MQEISIKKLTFFLQKHSNRINRSNRTGNPITAAFFFAQLFLFSGKNKCKLFTQQNHLILIEEGGDTFFSII
jgi:hypothetical protein